MRKAIAALLFLFSTVAWSELPPPDIQRIINQTDEQYSNCRDGKGGTDPDTNPYCIKGRELFENLEKLGWCYGHEGQYGYEKSWEPCAKPADAKKEQQSKIDFDAIALAMYSTYMSYGNGVAAMIAEENKCWSSSKKNKDISGACSVSALTGAFIESAYAREQGRQPAPNYQGDVIRKRIFANFEKIGMSQDQADTSIKFATENVDKILTGLMNAGMQ